MTCSCRSPSITSLLSCVRKGDPTIDAKHIGPRIKELREERLWTQELLSEIADVGLRAIYRIEAGEEARGKGAGPASAQRIHYLPRFPVRPNPHFCPYGQRGVSLRPLPRGVSRRGHAREWLPAVAERLGRDLERLGAQREDTSRFFPGRGASGAGGGRVCRLRPPRTGNGP